MERLPTELLLKVYASLGSIEDAIHLSWTSRKIYAVLANPTSYIHTMRSIIHSSETHRYDLQLQRLLELQKDVAKEVRETGTQIDVQRLAHAMPLHNDSPGSNFESRLYWAIKDEERKLTESQINDIVARYQGLHPLQDLYYTTPGDRIVNFHAADLVLLEQLEKVQDRNLPPPAGHTRKLDADQRARFHVALTHYWIVNLIRWISAHFKYRVDQTGFDTRIDLLATLTPVHAHLLPAIDLLEVYLFLYTHLLPRHAHALAENWNSPLHYPSFRHWRQAPPAEAARLADRLRFWHAAAAAALSPADLLDLALRDNLTRHSPYPYVPVPTSTLELITPLPALWRQERWGEISAVSAGRLGPPVNQLLISHGMGIGDHHCTYLQALVCSRAEEVLSGKKLWGGTAVVSTAGKALLKVWAAKVAGNVWEWQRTEEKARIVVGRWNEGRVK